MTFILLPGFLVAQDEKSVITRDEQIGITSLEAKLDSLFASFSKDVTPGCAVTVLKDGKVLVKRSYGMASLEHRVPFSHKTVVRMPYSEAREFIAIAAVLMERDGTLKFDDHVRKFFPQLPAWAEKVTVRDLLNHRSGFSDEWAVLLLTQASMSNRLDESQFLRFLAAQPEPEIAPGKGYLYSNSDFGLLRLVMERASGKKLPDWMQARMFEPLKMRSTLMQRNPLDIVPDKADSYLPAGANKYAHARVQKTSPGGNYFILTNAEDMQLWAAAHADSSSEIARAFARLWNEIRKVPGKENHSVVGYSQKQIAEKTVVVHEGVGGWNYLTRIPAERLTIITLGNLHNDGFAEQNQAIVSHLLNVQPPPKPQFLVKPIVVEANHLRKYTGKYLWRDQVSWESVVPSRKFSEFYVEGDKLKVLYNPGYTITLVPVGDDIFYFGEEGFGAQFIFTGGATDAPRRVEVKYDDGFPGVTMAKDSTVTWQPTQGQLAAVTGKFYSPHLDFYWTIEQNADGKLFIKRPTIADTPLVPDDGANRFRFNIESYPGITHSATIQFLHNKTNDITHFIVRSGRIMKHRFEKIRP